MQQQQLTEADQAAAIARLANRHAVARLYSARLLAIAHQMQKALAEPGRARPAKPPLALRSADLAAGIRRQRQRRTGRHTPTAAARRAAADAVAAAARDQAAG